MDFLSRLNRSADEARKEEKEDALPQEIVQEVLLKKEEPASVEKKPSDEAHVSKVKLSGSDRDIAAQLFQEIVSQKMQNASPDKLRRWFIERVKILEIEDENSVLNMVLTSVQSLKLAHDEHTLGGVEINTVEEKTHVIKAKAKISPLLMERIDAAAAAKLDKKDLQTQIEQVVIDLLNEQDIQLNQSEQKELIIELLDDMLGFGPLEPLLADEAVTDILVNGPFQIYVERKGKLELSPIKFRDNAHVMNIATRIVSKIGRRIDETSPLCDARLPDGSRVNIIIPPLALDGASISIRKFPKYRITLDTMAKNGSISDPMGTVLKIAARSRLNILISGGTGSGKTTTLNALSQLIDLGERIVTIEDAAELQLQQPHVVRLETRPPNLEGEGEITMRDLVKNALRMRPDRVILGEIRGAEAVDMLQAMNTGHDGSLCTIHANNPREALTRLENMVGLAGINLPAKAVRTQIASAVDMIIQVSRMRDGVRRITYITEIVGMEEDVVTTQDLFRYEFEGEGDDGRLKGDFKSSGIRPFFIEKANYFGLERALLAAME